MTKVEVKATLEEVKAAVTNVAPDSVATVDFSGENFCQIDVYNYESFLAILDKIFPNANFKMINQERESSSGKITTWTEYEGEQYTNLKFVFSTDTYFETGCAPHTEAHFEIKSENYYVIIEVYYDSDCNYIETISDEDSVYILKLLNIINDTNAEAKEVISSVEPAAFIENISAGIKAMVRGENYYNLDGDYKESEEYKNKVQYLEENYLNKFAKCVNSCLRNGEFAEHWYSNFLDELRNLGNAISEKNYCRMSEVCNKIKSILTFAKKDLLKTEESSAENCASVIPYVVPAETVEVEEIKTAFEIALEELKAAEVEYSEIVKLSQAVQGKREKENEIISDYMKNIRKTEGSYKRSKKRDTQARLYEQMVYLRECMADHEEKADFLKEMHNEIWERRIEIADKKNDAKKAVNTAAKVEGYKFIAILCHNDAGNVCSHREYFKKMSDTVSYICYNNDMIYQDEWFICSVDDDTRYIAHGLDLRDIDKFENLIDEYDAKYIEAELATTSGEKFNYVPATPEEEFNFIVVCAIHYFTLGKYTEIIDVLKTFCENVASKDKALFETAKAELQEWIEIARKEGVDVPDVSFETVESVQGVEEEPQKATFEEVNQKVKLAYITGKNGNVRKIWGVYRDSEFIWNRGFYKVDQTMAKKALEKYGWTIKEFDQANKAAKEEYAKLKALGDAAVETIEETFEQFNAQKVNLENETALNDKPEEVNNYCVEIETVNGGEKIFETQYAATFEDAIKICGYTNDELKIFHIYQVDTNITTDQTKNFETVGTQVDSTANLYYEVRTYSKEPEEDYTQINIKCFTDLQDAVNFTITDSDERGDAPNFGGSEVLKIYNGYRVKTLIQTYKDNDCITFWTNDLDREFENGNANNKLKKWFTEVTKNKSKDAQSESKNFDLNQKQEVLKMFNSDGDFFERDTDFNDTDSFKLIDIKETDNRIEKLYKVEPNEVFTEGFTFLVIYFFDTREELIYLPSSFEDSAYITDFDYIENYSNVEWVEENDFIVSGGF